MIMIELKLDVDIPFSSGKSTAKEIQMFHTIKVCWISSTYARCALRRMHVHVIKRERRFKAQAPLLLCHSRAHHSIVH